MHDILYLNGYYTGGERRVVELLEDQSGKLLNKALIEGEDEKRRKPHWSLRNFFLRPAILGKYLLTIEKFGLVQYVSHTTDSPCGNKFHLVFGLISTPWIAQMILKTVCAFLALVLEICGVYGNGEFKWYYGYVSDANMYNYL